MCACVCSCVCVTGFHMKVKQMWKQWKKCAQLISGPTHTYTLAHITLTVSVSLYKKRVALSTLLLGDKFKTKEIHTHTHTRVRVHTRTVLHTSFGLEAVKEKVRVKVKQWRRYKRECFGPHSVNDLNQTLRKRHGNGCLTCSKIKNILELKRFLAVKWLRHRTR